MVKSEKTPFGEIYRATNIKNGKVYMGQTIASRWGEDKNPIEERWKEEVRDAYAKQRRGEDRRYIENAIIKHGVENFNLKKEDIAYSQEELDKKETEYIKKYDSMNPDKGYNLKEGGRGGRLSEVAKEKLSKIGKEKWQNDLEYQKKQLNERRERSKDSEFIDKMNNLNKEKGKNPKFREKMSKVGSEKWQNDLEYQKKQLKERGERGKDPRFREKMRDVNKVKRKEITDKREFLEDIQKMKNKEITKKYDMNKATVSKRIQEMLGKHGVKNHTELKNYLEGKNLDEVVKEINERMDKPFQNYEGKTISSDKREFFEDIQKMQKNEIDYKYKMDGKTINRRIKEMLGEQGANNYTEAKKYLNGKSLDDVLKNIEKGRIEKPDDGRISEEKFKKNDEESKEQNEQETKKSETSEDKREDEIEKKDEKTEQEQNENEVKESQENPLEEQENDLDNSQESVREVAREKLDNQSNESLENSDQNISFKPSGMKKQDSNLKVGDTIIFNGVEYVVKEVRSDDSSPDTNSNPYLDTLRGATEGVIRRDIDFILLHLLDIFKEFSLI